jgi:hypothetical protein
LGFPWLSDFAFQVQITFIAGDGGGFDFRFNNNYGYLFYIQQDGTYTVLREDGTQFTPLFHDSSLAISTGQGQQNLIGVLAQGNTFAFIVNNQYITSVSENTYGHGYVEALAASLSGHVADVAFEDAKAWAV